MHTPDASQDYGSPDYHRIRRVNVSTRETTFLAGGSGSSGNRFSDGVGTSALFYYPFGVAIDPTGAFALVAVRAPWPLAAAASRPPPAQSASQTC